MAQSRNEDALENILGAHNELLPPESENERILHNILGGSYIIGEPTSRISTLLKQILDEGYMPEDEVYGDIINAKYGV